MTTVAVTGVRGFVASRLVRQLLARQHRVIGVVRPGRDASDLAASGIEIRSANLDAANIDAAAFQGADAVVHLSGMRQGVALVPALERAGVKKGVFVSSAGVYTKLESSGADAKRRGEDVLRGSSLGYTILRPSMIYGNARDRNMVRMLGWLRRLPIVVVPGGGGTLQQPVHVDDLVQAILAALDLPADAHGEYDVGGPDALPLAVVIRTCAAALGRGVLIVPAPLGPIHALVVLARRLGLPSPVSPEQVLRLDESKAVDIGPARRALGFSPRPFREGIFAEARELPLAGRPR